MKFIKRYQKIIFPVIIVLLNLILKLLHIDSRDIVLDEAFTIFNSQKDIHSLIEIDLEKPLMTK